MKHGGDGVAGSAYRRARARLIDGSIRFFSHMRQFSPYQRAARRRCEQILDVPYLPDGKKAHRLDIFRPKQHMSNLPVIIYIHGGGFVMCSKDTHRGIGLIYADHGYVVFNINYRLAPKYRYPAAFEDAAAAYCWIVDNAARYGGDPSRIIVAGESAGGNLTLALTVSSCFRRDEPAAKNVWAAGIVPSISMPICGLLQVSDPRRLKGVHVQGNRLPGNFGTTIARDVSRAYLGSGYRVPRAETALADPLLVLESDAVAERTLPVTYAMAGTGDILIGDTQRLESALNRRGVRNVVRYYPGAGHAFHLLGTGPRVSEFWRDHFTFLSREVLRQNVFDRQASRVSF